MLNPLIDIMRQYERVPLSAVIVDLRRQGGPLRVQIIRYGGSSGAIAPDADMVLHGVTGWQWEHLPDIDIDIPGEYYRHEVAPMVRAAARYSDAIDVLQIVADQGENHWHYRPCNPAHWSVHKMGNRTYRMPRAAIARAEGK